jgi:hypothetical protein
MFILGILFSGEERAMMRRSAMTTWEQDHPLGPGVQATDRKFPIQDPLWNNNYTTGKRKMVDLRNLIIMGIRESVPRS